MITSISNFIIQIIGHFGYFAVVFLMTLESANIPIPSEVIMPFAGFLVASGRLDLLSVVLAGTFGNWLGSSLSYWLGLFGGRPLVIKYGELVHFDHRHLEHSDRWFAKYGDESVFLGRLIPIVRTFISLPAGISRMNFGKFSLYTILGALPFSYLLAWLGYKLGQNWGILKQYFHYFDAAVVFLAVVLIIWYLIEKRAKSA